ncbi:putative transcriptional regulator [Lacibacter cauensis]|uniref:Putative transcriptional regulator n=1 Tax=Lacibacter cauensis TaxID=510947 RepID=A0A562SVD4_9BACT|nr:YqgE/AlgH family protein [Lacibacter cauensis]TWI84994.1 putative transcriptional regulator [Lacibacter cauensis]
MNIKAGTIIISTALLDDSEFEKVAIVITEHNEKGAVGYVFNQPFPRNFNELEEFKHSIPVPLYAGGPVQTDMLYFMHCRPDLVEGGDLVAADVYMNGDFRKAVQLLNNGTLSIHEVRLFIGYCGWDAGELEAELEEGSWEVTNAPIDLVFAASVTELW